MFQRLRALFKKLVGVDPVVAFLRRSQATVALPRYVVGIEGMSIGRDVRIGPNSRIEALHRYRDQVFTPRLTIGTGTSIEWNLTLVCVNRCEIGDHVMISSNVLITDTTHASADGTIPYLHQPITAGGHVKIGSGAWVGYNVAILANVTIGEQAIIGANSVVKSDIPAYCMAVGSPARVVRRFDLETRQWVKV